MPENIYEESKYKIKATLKESSSIMAKKYTGKLDLVYKKGDATVKTDADIDVSSGSVDREYDVPKVDDKEDNYTLKVIANYGTTKEKTRVLAEAVVWPKKVKLTAKDSKDDSLVKQLPYKIVHSSGKPTLGNTNDSGVGNEDLKKCSYSIEAGAPWELVSDKNDTKNREHDIVVRRNPEAKFLKPDVKGTNYVADGSDKYNGVRQYVNMTTAEEGCDGKGHQIEFEVCHKNQNQGLANDKIYIKVTFSKKSKRDDPKPALLAPAAEIATKDSGKTFTGYAEIDADGGSAKFKLQLGYAGGESFKVEIGYSKKDPKDAQIIFVTWRKLGYQIRYPALMKTRMKEKTREDGTTKYFDLPDSVFNKAKSRLGDVYVEYTNLKSHEYVDPPNGSPCIMTKGFFEHSVAADQMFVLDGSCNWAVGASAFDGAADNRENHVTLCDAAVSSGGSLLNPTIKLTEADSEKVIDTNAGNKYFAKTHKAADQENLDVGGYTWKADLSGVVAGDQKKKPITASAFTAGNGGGPKSLTVEEPTVGGGPITVTFNDKDELPASEKNKIKSYYKACYTDVDALRQADLKLNFTVTGSSGAEGDDVRQQAVLDAITGIDTDEAEEVPAHPGMADDGTPREGPMTDVTITHTTSRQKRFELPTANPTDPGNWVGAPTATTCPTLVEFDMDGTYSINGNAGGGSQLLVLRDSVPGPCSSTICHELGHAMGMAVMPLTGADAYPVPSGLSKPKHVDASGPYYLDGDAPFSNGIRNLHRGPHCSEGMPKGNRSDPKFKGWSPGASDTVCIMWGSGGNDDNRKQYCETCAGILRARELTDIRSNWDGRADG